MENGGGAIAAVPAEGSLEGAFSAPLGESTNPSGEEVVNLSDLPENSAKASSNSSGTKPSAGTAGAIEAFLALFS